MPMLLHKYVFVASAIAVGIYPTLVYWRIYGIYQRAGEWVKKVGFFWFSFYVQSPEFGRGAEVLQALPQDLQIEVAAIRLRQRRESIAILLWIVFLVSLGVLLKSLPHG